MFKRLLYFIYQYIINDSFRNLCDSAMKLNKAIDEHIDRCDNESALEQSNKQPLHKKDEA